MSRKPIHPALAKALTDAQYTLVTDDTELPHQLWLPGQLDPKVYKDFKHILECLGGKWKKWAHRVGMKYEHGQPNGRHLFPEDPRPIIADILASGKLPQLNPLDYFPTPPVIVDGMLSDTEVEEAISCLKWRIEKGEHVRALEPSAGTGAFAVKLAELLGGPQHVLCVELNPVNARTLRKKGFTVVEQDFMEFTPENGEKFPLVVMNPPFDGNLWKKHLDYALTLCEPKGTVTCVTPSSALTKSTAAHTTWLRKILARGRGPWEHDAKSFKDSGTNVSTVTLTIGEERTRAPEQGYPSRDAFEFDVTMSSDRPLHEKWLEEVSRIAEEFPAPTAKGSLDKFLAGEGIARLRAVGQEINDTLLFGSQHVALELTDEDFTHILLGWLESHREMGVSRVEEAV